MSKGSRRIILGWLAVAAMAAVVHCAVIVAYPRLLMSYFCRQVVEHGGGNRFIHFERPTAKDRIVRMPSPDLLYSAVAFDLSDGPLRITAPVPGSYMSLSMYASNTDNFFVINDLEAKGGKFDLVLSGPGTADPDLPGARLVHAPSITGIIALRCFVGRDDQAARSDSVRRQAKCELLRYAPGKG